VSELCSLAFQAVLLVFGIVLLRAMGHETAVSIDWIPMVWVYSVLPISGGLMVLISLTRLVLVLRGESGVLAAPSRAPTAASSE
jgi:TRAP-type C4-dicarboxylate transport system permease small subunit